jgi:extradiol dioxygenase family protein
MLKMHIQKTPTQLMAIKYQYRIDNLLHQLKKKNQTFIIEPKIRFAGQPGEQRTMFLKDPSGNALEFKAFKNLDSLFST